MICHLMMITLRKSWRNQIKKERSYPRNSSLKHQSRNLLIRNQQIMLYKIKKCPNNLNSKQQIKILSLRLRLHLRVQQIKIHKTIWTINCNLIPTTLWKKRKKMSWHLSLSNKSDNSKSHNLVKVKMRKVRMIRNHFGLTRLKWSKALRKMIILQ